MQVLYSFSFTDFHNSWQNVKQLVFWLTTVWHVINSQSLMINCSWWN